MHRQIPRIISGIDYHDSPNDRLAIMPKHESGMSAPESMEKYIAEVKRQISTYGTTA